MRDDKMIFLYWDEPIFEKKDDDDVNTEEEETK